MHAYIMRIYMMTLQIINRLHQELLIWRVLGTQFGKILI